MAEAIVLSNECENADTIELLQAYQRLNDQINAVEENCLSLLSRARKLAIRSTLDRIKK